MKKILIITCALLSIFSCKNAPENNSEYSEKRTIDEKAGQNCLKEAREKLSQKKYDEARTTIERMRKEHPLGLNAREEGILLLDSINLFEAEKQLKDVNEELRTALKNKKDSLQIEFDDLFQKSKFYRRKLEHDKKENGTL